MSIICVVCKTDTSPSWWKCCPKHTTERGNDVVCFSCANECFKSKEVVLEVAEITVDELIVGATTIYENNKKLLTSREVAYLLAIINLLDKLRKEKAKICKHEPYRDDTSRVLVVRCRKCPATSHVLRNLGVEPTLPQWRIN